MFEWLNQTAAWIARRLPVALILPAFTIGAWAHSADTSYVRVDIGAERVNVTLTYDLAALSKIEVLDDDGDHRVTRVELERHTPGILDFLASSTLLEVAGMAPGLGVFEGLTWRSEAADGIHEREFHANTSLVGFRFARALDDLPEDVTLTLRCFKTLGENHSVLGKFVLSGVETEVAFTQFEPDFLFDTGYQPPLLPRLLKFLRAGVEHIVFGYDHLCFLAALILVARIGDMVKVITAFTVAHSVTLALAVLDVVRLPSRLVESAVALTIVWVALENVFTRTPRHRWTLAFLFGLIHGFAFASILETLALPSSGVIRCLLSFNAGVELGQLAIMAVLLPLVLCLQRSRHSIFAVKCISACLAAAGTAWLVSRLA